MRRQVFIPDDLWRLVKVRAASHGVGISDVIVTALTEWLPHDGAPGLVGAHYTADSTPIEQGNFDGIATSEQIEALAKPIIEGKFKGIVARTEWPPITTSTTPGFGSSRPAPKPTKKAK